MKRAIEFVSTPAAAMGGEPGDGREGWAKKNSAGNASVMRPDVEEIILMRRGALTVVVEFAGAGPETTTYNRTRQVSTSSPIPLTLLAQISLPTVIILTLRAGYRNIVKIATLLNTVPLVLK